MNEDEIRRAWKAGAAMGAAWMTGHLGAGDASADEIAEKCVLAAEYADKQFDDWRNGRLASGGKK